MEQEGNMSVYIKGMEMPKECYVCPFFFGDRKNLKAYCTVNEKEWIDLSETLCGIRHQDCPLISVPGHGRLIDADKIGLTDFEIILCQADENRYKSALQMLLEKIEKMPTIIPADKEDGE